MRELAGSTPSSWAPDLPVARVVAEADRFDGVLHREQLLALGVSGSSISRLVERGWLARRFDAVYSVGRRRLTQRGRHRAALLAVGGDAALAGFAAGEVQRVIEGESARIDVVTTTRGLDDLDGVRVHCVRRLPPEEVVVIDGMRATSVARTLLDLAALVSAKSLLDCCSRAAAQGKYDRLAILAVLGRGRRGSRALRKVLATMDVGEGHTRSELEHAFRRLIERYAITPPEFNSRLWAGDRSIVPDALWRDLRFVVELDSRRHHGHEPGFFKDREKDLIYEELGLNKLPLTWRQVVGQETRVAAALIKRVGTIG
jgi:very-short-patch-repair endonuclease